MTSDSEFVEFWNAILAPKFLRFQDILVEGLGKHSRVVFARDAVVIPGERVLDVGCGFGDTVVDLAGRAGPTGRVTGIDCSRTFLDIGRSRAERAGITNVDWVEGDAETYNFGRPFDFWFSRFGTMFFSMPVAALRHLRTHLEPGGRMMMIVWRERDLNEWAALPRETVLRFLPEPDSPDTCGPGPFSMAQESVVAQQLRAAGYADVEFERIDAQIMVGRTVEDAVDFQLALGPSGEICREAGELAEQRNPQIREALNEALAPHLTGEGVMLSSSSWCVRARNPR